jgi:hypothetical protein
MDACFSLLTTLTFLLLLVAGGGGVSFFFRPLPSFSLSSEEEVAGRSTIVPRELHLKDLGAVNNSTPEIKQQNRTMQNTTRRRISFCDIVLYCMLLHTRPCVTANLQ